MSFAASAEILDREVHLAQLARGAATETPSPRIGYGQPRIHDVRHVVPCNKLQKRRAWLWMFHMITQASKDRPMTS